MKLDNWEVHLISVALRLIRAHWEAANPDQDFSRVNKLIKEFDDMRLVLDAKQIQTSG